MHTKNKSSCSCVQLLTFCTHQHRMTLGQIHERNGKHIWQPTPLGEAVAAALETLRYTESVFLISDYVVMPNHVHMLIMSQRANDKTTLWFAAQCKHTLSKRMLRVRPAKDPFWEPSFERQYLQQEHTQYAMSQCIREHHRLWNYDSLNHTLTARPSTPAKTTSWPPLP